MTTTDWYHEKALQDFDVDAEVVIDSAGRVLLSTTDDALDALLDGAERLRGLDDTLAEVESEAHDSGYDAGREYGYEEACEDITGETGAAWEIVAKLVAEARDAGYQAACDDAGVTPEQMRAQGGS